MEKQLVEALQNRLRELGYYTGKIDGDAGPLTKLAVSDFKRASGLNPRVFVGPITLTRLFSSSAERRPLQPATPASAAMPWMVEARRLLGTKEYAGSANNPVIMDWADNLDQWYPGDDVPWCGLFVAHCMAYGAPLDPQDFNRLGARNWSEFGRVCDPREGAVLTFWRGSKSGWQGHVGFYVGEDATAYRVLGGNQSNAVTITRISKDRFLEARWPKSFALSGQPIHFENTDTPLSTNEA
jgi:uncharacterized protein (TIGR02594 family)